MLSIVAVNMFYLNLLKTLITFSLFVQINALCYFPDGETIPRQDSPCRSEGESACCGQGYACMSNGLCKLTEYVSNPASDQSTYVRGSCSDSTWNSPNCPNVCLTPSNGDNPHGGMGLGKCDNFADRYYCINNVTFPPIANALPLSSICASSTYYLDFAGTATTVTIIGVATTSSITTSSSLATTTSAVSTSDLSFQVASPTSPQTGSPSTSTAAVSQSRDKDYTVPIAAGVAVPLGVIAISVAVYLFWRSRKPKSKVSHATAPNHDLPVRETKPHLLPYGVSSMHPSPMHSPPAVYQEQPHWAAPTELPVNHGHNGHR